MGKEILERYSQASAKYTAVCASNLDCWHRPDVAEFSEIKNQLLPLAEAGDVHCQYAIAVIFWLGLLCDSEERFYTEYPSNLQEATRWWIAAAQQGHWTALDNLITCGVGPEAEKARRTLKEFEAENRHLIRWQNRMPVYNGIFMREFCRKLYGKALVGL